MQKTLKTIIKRLLRLHPVEVANKRSDGQGTVLPNSVFIPLVLESLANHPLLPLNGNSMRPFLCHRRDKAILAPIRHLKIGDPVLVENEPGHYILHRLIHIEGELLTLLGDGNLLPEYCKIVDVRACVDGFYRKGRKQPDLISGKKWQTYSFLWMHLVPVRKYLLAIHHIIFRSLKVLD